MNTSPNNQVLLVFRNIGDQRVPYIIELDATMTVLVDRPASMGHSAAPAVEPLTPAPRVGSPELAHSVLHVSAARVQEARMQAIEADRQKAYNDLREAAIEAGVVTQVPELASVSRQVQPVQKFGDGLTEEIIDDKGHKRIVYHPTPTDIWVGEWVTSLIVDNPIPGTDELRAEFFAAEEALKEKHAADGTACRPCDVGALIRKYRAKLESLGYLK